MMFEPVFKPSLFRVKADQDASWPAMPGDHNLLVSGKSKVVGQIILHLCQRHGLGLTPLSPGANRPLGLWRRWRGSQLHSL